MYKIIFSLLLIFYNFISISQTDTIKLKEITIYGIRTDVISPINETTINSDKISNSYIGEDIPVILNFKSPSITYYSDAGTQTGYMYYRLRGIDQTRINVTLNGVPLNEPEDQGAYFNNYIDFSSFVNSMQIQRGVGTSSNGTSSYIGSINIETPKIENKSILLERGLGSWNTYRLSARSTNIIGNFKYLLKYSNMGTDGYRYNSGNIGNSIFISTEYSYKNHLLKYHLIWGYTKNEMAWMPSNESNILIDRKHNPLYDEYDKFNQKINILSYTNKINKKIYLNTSIFLNQLDGDYDIRFGDVYNYKLKSNFPGIISTININGNKFRHNFGVSYDYYTRQHSMSVKKVTELIHNNIGKKNGIGIFYKNEYKIFKNTLTYLDIQFKHIDFFYYPDFYSSENWRSHWNFINPKIGITHILGGDSKISAFYGISNREPTRIDLFNYYIPLNDGYDPDNLTTEIIKKWGFNNIKPERVNDLEFGYYVKRNKVELDVNLFYMFFKDAILPIGELNSIGLNINKNVSKSIRYGMELETSYEIWILKIYGNLTLMNSKIKSGEFRDNQMLLTPNFIVNSSVIYESRNYQLSIINRYQSGSYLTNLNNNDFYLPGYTITNMNINFFINENTNLSIFINNIFNTNYYNSGQVAMVNNIWTRQYFVASTRGIFVTIKNNIK